MTTGIATEKPMQLYTIDEAARILSVRPSWLRDKVTAGVVPHTRLGRHVRFSEDHLADIVRAGERACPGAAERPAFPTGRLRRRRSA